MAVPLPQWFRSRVTTFAAALIAFAALWPATSASADISYDGEFGGDGVVDAPITPVRDIATQGEDTLVAGGDGEIVLARLNPDGGLDPEFHGDGIADPFPDFAGELRGIEVVDDGIIVAGKAGPGGPFVAKLTPDGYAYTTFGVFGIRTFAWNPAAPLSGSTGDPGVDAAGRILVGSGAASEAENGGSDAFMARLTPLGDLDGAFGGDGISSLGESAPVGIRPAHEGMGTVVPLADGRACGAGSIDYGTGFVSHTFCFADDGSPAPGAGGHWYEGSITDIVGTPTGEPLIVGEEGVGATHVGRVSWLDGWLEAPSDPPGPPNPLPNGVDLLDDDTAVVTGERYLYDAGLAPAFWIVDHANQGGAVDYGRVPLPSGGEASAEGVAAIDAANFSTVIKEGAQFHIARLTTEELPVKEPPPRDRGTLSLGELRAPRTFDGLVNHGARIPARCSLDCNVRFELRASRRAVKRFDLPTRRISGWHVDLAGETDNAIRFRIGNKAANRLRLSRHTPTEKLRLRVVTVSVSYSD